MSANKLILILSVFAFTVTLCRHKFSLEEIATHRNWEYLPNAAGCGIASFSDRIVGGRTAALGQYPWLTRIGYQINCFEITYLCAGSIINRWYILTANHCFLGILGRTIKEVRLGENFLTHDEDCEKGVCAPKVQDIPIEYFVRYHNVVKKSAVYGDIGLIKMDRPALFNDFVYPICLPNIDVIKNIADYLNLGTKVEVAGWGTIDSERQVIPDQLMFLRMPIVNLTICKSNFPQNPIDESQICIGSGEGKDTCVGDSGGPIIKAISLNALPRYFLFGIVSYGMKWCGISAAVYTNVTHYMNWILDNIESIP